MEFTAREIATLLGGEVIGDLDAKIDNVSKIEEGKPGTLTFLANPKYNSFIYETKASVVLVNRTFIPEKDIKPTLIKVQDAYQALATLLDFYVQTLNIKRGIETPSYIDFSSDLGEGCYVGAFAYVGEGVKIGNNVQIHPQCWIGKNSIIEDNTILFSGVKIYPESKIGKNCIFHAGVVIGSDGFGFAPREDGSYSKIHQIGNVIIEDDVEIGANSTIDCATMGSTILRKGVKLDNLVQIAHNAEIGKHTVIAAQSAIAGSSQVGDYCAFGGQTAVAGHIKVGNNVKLGGKTGISKDTPDGLTMMGEWGMEAGRFRRVYAVFKNLPELFTEVNKLRKEVNKIIED